MVIENNQGLRRRTSEQVQVQKEDINNNNNNADDDADDEIIKEYYINDHDDISSAVDNNNNNNNNNNNSNNVGAGGDYGSSEILSKLRIKEQQRLQNDINVKRTIEEKRIKKKRLSSFSSSSSSSSIFSQSNNNNSDNNTNNKNNKQIKFRPIWMACGISLIVFVLIVLRIQFHTWYWSKTSSMVRDSLLLRTKNISEIQYTDYVIHCQMEACEYITREEMEDVIQMGKIHWGQSKQSQSKRNNLFDRDHRRPTSPSCPIYTMKKYMSQRKATVHIEVADCDDMTMILSGYIKKKNNKYYDYYHEKKRKSLSSMNSETEFENEYENDYVFDSLDIDELDCDCF